MASAKRGRHAKRPSRANRASGLAFAVGLGMAVASGHGVASASTGDGQSDPSSNSATDYPTATDRGGKSAAARWHTCDSMGLPGFLTLPRGGTPEGPPPGVVAVLGAITTARSGHAFPAPLTCPPARNATFHSARPWPRGAQRLAANGKQESDVWPAKRLCWHRHRRLLAGDLRKI